MSSTNCHVWLSIVAALATLPGAHCVALWTVADLDTTVSLSVATAAHGLSGNTVSAVDCC